MTSPSAFQLTIAWAGSALAGAVAHTVGLQIAMTLLDVPFRVSMALRVLVLSLAFGLILQLIYGGMLYVALRRLGWFTLPIVLLAYLGPLSYIFWEGIDTPKDLTMAIPRLAFVAVLASVGWYLASSPSASS